MSRCLLSLNGICFLQCTRSGLDRGGSGSGRHTYRARSFSTERNMIRGEQEDPRGEDSANIRMPSLIQRINSNMMARKESAGMSVYTLLE
jgi:hypothetical protein